MRHRRGTLKIRIAGTFVVWALLLNLAMALLIPAIRDHFAVARLDEVLRSEAREVGRFVAEGMLRPSEVVPQTQQLARENLVTGGRILFRVTRDDGTIIGVSDPLRPPEFARPALDAQEAAPGVLRPLLQTIQVPSAGAPVRFRTAATRIRAPDGHFYEIIAASPLVSHDALRSLLLWLMIGGMIAGVLGAGLAGWIVAGQICRRLENVASAVRAVSPSRMDERILIPMSDDEIGRMAADVNAMLDRIATTVRGMERYMAEVSHELRTPVATLLAEAHVMKRSVRADPAVAAFVEGVEEEMRRLSRLIESFLTLARFEHGTAFLSTTLVNLNDVAVESIQHSRRYARHSSVNLGLQLFEAAEAESEPVVHGDGELLRIAIDNLIRNAIQHSEPGATVDVRVERRDGHASIAVRDQGPGIPQDYLPRIFDRFVQAPPGRPQGGGESAGGSGGGRGGLGLGLAIAKAVVDLHKGEISAETREPRGARFAIRLPVAPRTADPPAPR